MGKSSSTVGWESQTVPRWERRQPPFSWHFDSLFMVQLSFSVACLLLVNFSSSFLHSCVERHIEEQGNLLRAPHFITENIDIWGNISSSGIKHKNAKEIQRRKKNILIFGGSLSILVSHEEGRNISLYRYFFPSLTRCTGLCILGWDWAGTA